jgi:phosphatidylglycerol:prolipoprotein diacylglycerol transferase
MALPFPDIDPVALSLGPFQIRWYALAYLAGFLGGWKYAVWLAGHDPQRRPNALDADNILPWIVLGVILGGRLGYVLFYNLGYYLQNPLQIPVIWEGGMSFHGGLLGVAVVCIAYARFHKFSALAMGDLVAAVVPIGLFFGRIANFINGELFGRVTTVPWAIDFPYGGGLPRHPSQLYEAFLEGIVLFFVLLWCWKKPEIRRAPGMIFGIFTIGYAFSRFLVEFVREPDPQIGLILEYFTLGQLLCLPMMMAGGLLIAYARKNRPVA